MHCAWCMDDAKFLEHNVNLQKGPTGNSLLTSDHWWIVLKQNFLHPVYYLPFLIVAIKISIHRHHHSTTLLLIHDLLFVNLFSLSSGINLNRD